MNEQTAEVGTEEKKKPFIKLVEGEGVVIEELLFPIEELDAQFNYDVDDFILKNPGVVEAVTHIRDRLRPSLTTLSTEAVRETVRYQSGMFIMQELSWEMNRHLKKSLLDQLSEKEINQLVVKYDDYRATATENVRRVCDTMFAGMMLDHSIELTFSSMLMNYLFVLFSSATEETFEAVTKLARLKQAVVNMESKEEGDTK